VFSKDWYHYPQGLMDPRRKICQRFTTMIVHIFPQITTRVYCKHTFRDLFGEYHAVPCLQSCIKTSVCVASRLGFAAVLKCMHIHPVFI